VPNWPAWACMFQWWSKAVAPCHSVRGRDAPNAIRRVLIGTLTCLFGTALDVHLPQHREPVPRFALRHGAPDSPWVWVQIEDLSRAHESAIRLLSSRKVPRDRDKILDRIAVLVLATAAGHLRASVCSSVCSSEGPKTCLEQVPCLQPTGDALRRSSSSNRRLAPKKIDGNTRSGGLWRYRGRGRSVL